MVTATHFTSLGPVKSRGAFDWFFKVRDRYETFIDAEAIVPWVFLRRVDEGGYKINQNYVFNPFQNKVIADGKHSKLPIMCKICYPLSIIQDVLITAKPKKAIYLRYLVL
jgi:hypothetical protein